MKTKIFLFVAVMALVFCSCGKKYGEKVEAEGGITLVKEGLYWGAMYKGKLIVPTVNDKVYTITDRKTGEVFVVVSARDRAWEIRNKEGKMLANGIPEPSFIENNIIVLEDNLREFFLHSLITNKRSSTLMKKYQFYHMHDGSSLVFGEYRGHLFDGHGKARYDVEELIVNHDGAFFRKKGDPAGEYRTLMKDDPEWREFK